MNAFQYFLPSTQRAAVDERLPASVGLSYAFDGQRAHAREVMGAGPDGKQGVVISPSDHRIGYYPNHQDWTPHPHARHDGNVIYVGAYRDALPTPLDLAKPRQLPGHTLELCDHQSWLIAIIRAWLPPASDGETARYYDALPKTGGLDPEAAKRGEVRWASLETEGQYTHLWPLANEYYESFSRYWINTDEDEVAADVQLDDTPDPFSDVTHLISAAVTVLAANYRVSVAEAHLLRLFDASGDVAHQLLRAAVDWPTVQSWLEKKREAATVGSSSNAGPEVNHSPDTSPVLATT